MRGLREAKTEDADEAVECGQRFGAAALGEVKIVHIECNVRY